jgi:hypothetical protein
MADGHPYFRPNRFTIMGGPGLERELIRARLAYNGAVLRLWKASERLRTAGLPQLDQSNAYTFKPWTPEQFEASQAITDEWAGLVRQRKELEAVARHVPR